MKYLRIVAIVALVAMTAISVASAGSGTPASKATAYVKDLTIIPPPPTGVQQENIPWTKILENDISTANMKDLFIDVSLECGLYTQTLVASKTGTKDTSMAESAVDVKVLIDNKPLAYPADVTYCKRTQTLSAWLQGLMGQCTVDANGVVTCDWTEEQIELILDTMNANSFNFVVPDLAQGPHTVSVWARIQNVTSTTSTLGQASAYGTIGHGSVTVESVRMIRGEEAIELQ